MVMSQDEARFDTGLTAYTLPGPKTQKRTYSRG